MAKVVAVAEGWEGWDDYSAFYDWENARTIGRRDVAFWRDLGLRVAAPVLELGCGTGRIAVPLGRAGVPVVGIDRSTPMLARARERVRRGRLQRKVRLVRGDIRALPFPAASAFGLVMAPYGMLQSLLRERDLSATLQSIARVLRPGALFGIDLVADLPNWSEYRRELRLSGWRPGRRSHITPCRIRAAGPQAWPHDFRAGIHRAPRARGPVQALRPRLSDGLRPPDAQAGRTGRLPRAGGARGL